MKFYSTNNHSVLFDPATAILKSLPDDNGLFMPERIPVMPSGFFSELKSKSLQEIAYEVSVRYFSPEIPEEVIRRIVEDAVNFPVPVRQLTDDTCVLELFHGPTLAFKDMGARFMARLMSWLNRNEQGKLTVLVATSGDTGSAVASGFFGVEGIEVVILYPSGKVSPLQEKQLTTNGGNIRALEIKGSFDDCQRIVKTAFLDAELNKRYRLTSANSINIARLIPQSFYYIDALRQMPEGSLPPVFVVPSGNFGNLTAGLLAHLSGMPTSGFIAATNRNDAVVRYLSGEEYHPIQTIPTISNAMDVGNPSNFARLLDMYGHDRSRMQSALKACAFDDEATRSVMRSCYERYGYMLDPHGAVGWLAWEQKKSMFRPGTPGIILETAHPVKFSEVVEETLGVKPEIPDSLKSIMNREKKAVLLSSEYSDFFSWMMA
ncbi:MAG: hypothetical protein RLZZ630_1256 [Bacteroidota bacterium]